jgi:sodium-dependent dicarboxylate transporter 2/3/5
MAVWWISEAIPIPATALLPILLFPVLGVTDGGEVTLAYANHLIFLFLGGFLIAVTIERWNLHRRMALHVIRVVGFTPDRIILRFMLATALLSMWISNTAATMMMATIGMAVLYQICTGWRAESITDETASQNARLGTTQMLGIGYSASIGGIATLIGTPPNAILAGVVGNYYGIHIGFLQWMLFGLPLSLLMLGICWIYLTRIAKRGGPRRLPGGRQIVEGEIRQLGPLKSQEKKVPLAVPVMGALAATMQMHPLGLMTAVAVAASFAFMLPVATPPNAIIFGTRYVTIQQMAKTGFWLNLIGVLLITLFVIYWLPIAWGIDITTLPDGWPPYSG